MSTTVSYKGIVEHVVPVVFYLTLGCAKNEVDTDRMRALLARAGYGETNKIEEADVVLINTCSFLASATQESIECTLALAEDRGGSAIDACKAMMFFAQQQKILGPCTFIAIPTTSGTGSEVTDFSVITDAEHEVKYPLIDTRLLPDVALLDAELTATVPPAVTAATGLDVLTHAIEAIVSVKANDFSDAMAEKAIKLLMGNLVETYQHPENIVARKVMHNASCMAGIAFNNAGLGLNHGMAHALGACFHIPHGTANAILLPYVIEFNAGCFDGLTPSADAYARIARLFDVCTAPSVRVSTLRLIRIIRQLKRQLAVPQTIQAAGVDWHAFAEQLDAMADVAVADRCTETNPRSCTVAEVKNLYIHAYFGVAGKAL